MLNITTQYTTIAEATQTQPGYLVEVVFSDETLRLSSFGNITWDSLSWLDSRIGISGISVNGSGSSTGQITFGTIADDPSLTVGYALSATKGFMGSRISIWTFDAGLVSGGVLPLEDAIYVFQGVWDDVQISELEVAVNVSSVNILSLYAPRVKIIKENGFNYLQPKGLKIPWGSEVFVLE